MDRDLYQKLEISQDASPEEIKKAYHVLAMKYHPDKSDDPESKQKFQEILEAYQILSDPQKKQKYDLTGVVDDDLPNNDPFVKFSFFSGFGNQALRRDSDVEVDYEQFIFGGSKGFVLKEEYLVDNKGNQVKPSPCPQCSRFHGFIQMISCSLCNGTNVINPRGAIKKTKETNYDLPIPEKSWPGRILDHSGKKFRLIPIQKGNLVNSGLDLIYINKIDIFKALLGIPETINLLKETYNITHTGPIQPEHKIIFENRGLYGPRGERGNLIFIYNIIFPKVLTDNQRRLLEEIVKI